MCIRDRLYTVGKKGEPDKPLFKDVVMVQAVHSGWTEVDLSLIHIDVYKRQILMLLPINEIYSFFSLIGN